MEDATKRAAQIDEREVQEEKKTKSEEKKNP